MILEESKAGSLNKWPDGFAEFCILGLGFIGGIVALFAGPILWYNLGSALWMLVYLWLTFIPFVFIMDTSNLYSILEGAVLEAFEYYKDMDPDLRCRFPHISGDDWKKMNESDAIALKSRMVSLIEETKVQRILMDRPRFTGILEALDDEVSTIKSTNESLKEINSR